jgi:hypothetical protein
VSHRAQYLAPPGRSIVSYLWDFGDGSPAELVAGGPSSTIVHVYPDQIDFTVTVTATDDLGAEWVTTGVAQPKPEDGAFMMMDPPPVLLFQHPVQVDGGYGNTARVGHRFVFGVSSQSILASVGVPYGRLLWDFDGDGVRDHQSDLEGSNVLDTFVAWQYPLPGTYKVKVRGFLIGSAVFDEEVMTVVVEPPKAPMECWIVQPRDGVRVWGPKVTLSAKCAPASLCSRVDFQVRPEGSAGPWTTVGTVTPPPYSALSVAWDATQFPAGRYELRAAATDTGNVVRLSTDLHSVIVEVDPTAPAITDDGVVREEDVNPDGATRSEIAGDTALDLPPYAFGTHARIRIERPTGNPHPLEARFQGLNFVPGSFRRLSLVTDGVSMVRPSRITLYSLNPDGVLDTLGVDPTKLSIWQFDDQAGKWVPLYGQLTQPGEDLIRATMSAMGDVGIVAEWVPRASNGSSDGGFCGLLGAELLILPGLLLLGRTLVRRRRAG